MRMRIASKLLVRMRCKCEFQFALPALPCTIKRENADLAGTWLKCVAELVCGNSFIREKAIKAARLPLQYMRYCHDIINILELPELHWICR